MAFSVISNFKNIPATSSCKTREDVARKLCGILRASGIDVVDGLDAEEACGRYPLSMFLLDTSSDRIAVGSGIDRNIDFLEKATGERFPRRYYLYLDSGRYASGRGCLDKHPNTVMAKPRKSDDGIGRLSIYYPDPSRYGLLAYAGDIVYDAWNGSIEYRETGHREVFALNEVARRDDSLTVELVVSEYAGDNWLRSNYSITMSTCLGTENTTSLDELFRQTISFPVETTGASIHIGYGGSFRVYPPDLPTKGFLSLLEERMTLDVGECEGGRYGRSGDFGVAYDVAPLAPEDLSEAISVLKADLDARINGNGSTPGYRYRPHNCVYTAYAMVMTPAPKGERRPVGHIVIGVSDGVHKEFCEFAVCRTDVNFVIGDIYLKTKQGGTVAFRRCGGRTMVGIKELIGTDDDLKIVRKTLAGVSHIRNRYAASAAIDSQTGDDHVACASVPAHLLRTIASMKFGAEFVERAYRMGYASLAEDVCDTVNSRRAWDRITALSDIVPGYVEDAKSLYTCFGLPKAWGKAVFGLCTSGEKGNGFQSPELRTAILSMQMAWDLEAALTGGKPSEASVPARAVEYAGIWKDYLGTFGLVGRGRINADFQDHWFFSTFRDAPVAMAATIRSFNRMSKKAASLGLGDRDSQVFLLETLQAYCQLKSVGIAPEDHGVLYEYGLPEDDIEEARAMVKRRCEAAQDVVASHRAMIDEKAHQVQEDKYAEFRKLMSWLECSDPKVSKRYVFKLPTKLYGNDDPYSLQSEGELQHNCVFNSYLSKLANAEYTVVLMRERDNPDAGLVTIGITKNLVMDQTYQGSNARITPEQAHAILAWRTKVNSRGKGAVLMPSAPGGWND